ncbi:hypothetical protein ACFLXA_02880 [Chloroflexota bacterium]
MAFADDVAVELQDSSNNVFASTEITRGINDALRMFSRKKPREITETAYTVAGTRLVDISGIKEDDLIFGYDERSFNMPFGVEYKVNQWPTDYRNFRVIPDPDLAYIELDLKNAPSTSDLEVRLRCYEIWTESNLPSGFDDLIVQLAAALCLQYKHLYYVNEWNGENTKFNSILSALDDMSNSIIEAESLLIDGTALIGDNRTSAATAVGNVDARITQALEDLSDGRDAIDDLRDSSIGAIDDVSARITQLVADIVTARTYFNKSNVGAPESEYLASANTEGQAAMALLSQARSYLTEETTAQSFRNQGVAELQASNVLLNQAAAYMKLEETVNSYRAQALAYLRNANSSLTETRGRMEQLKLRLNSINLSTIYRQEADRKMALVIPELNRYAIRKATVNWNKV